MIFIADPVLSSCRGLWLTVGEADSVVLGEGVSVATARPGAAVCVAMSALSGRGVEDGEDTGSILMENDPHPERDTTRRTKGTIFSLLIFIFPARGNQE